MKRYRVSIIEHHQRILYVEAADEREAVIKANTMLEDGSALDSPIEFLTIEDPEN